MLNKISKVINDNVGLIIIILILAISSILTWFFLIPLKIISYDIGINLVSDFISGIITVLIIDSLIKWNETKNWKKVEKLVLSNIGTNLSHIFRMFVLCYENGYESWFLFKRWDKKIEKNFTDYMDKIVDKKLKIKEEEILLYIKTKEQYEEIDTWSNNLGEIEDKYQKYLSPEISILLIKIRQDLDYIDFFSKTYSKNQYIFKYFEKIDVKFEETGKIFSEAEIKVLSNNINNIMINIYELYKKEVPVFS